MCSSVFRDPILAVKLARYFATLKNFLNFFLLSLNHLNRTVSDLLYKIFSKNKRPWPQTNYRRYLVRIV